MLSASAISAAIRAKKKKMKDSEPEMIGTNPRPDIDAQGVYDLEEKGRIEDAVGAAPKINADDQTLDGSIQVDAKGKRMARLKAMFDTLKK